MASSGDGGGPWFCHFHFNSPDPSFAAQVVQASQSYKPETKEDSLRALQQEAKRYCGDNVTGHAAFKWHAKGLNMSRPGNTDWAKKIIKDHADGKHVYLIALQKARLALGIVEEKG
jgi:hypothetical protein